MFSFRSTVDQFRRTARLGVPAAIVATSGIIALGAPVAAATPVVDVTIEVNKTGSEPFELTTWDGVDLATAGTDAGTDNDVVRLQDSITYRVEASVNDGAVDDLVAEVLLDPKQRWIEVPSACKTSLSIYPNLSPVSSIVDSVTGLEGGDARTLICNFGAAIEGTKVVAFPAARAIGASATGDVTLNDDTVGATVSATGTSAANGNSNTAVDGPTATTVTADFKVNLLKELKITDVDDDGEPLYAPQNRSGPAGEPGMIMEYKIKAQYQNGSLIADSDETTFLENYDLVDYFTDNNDGNNVGGLSSGAVLYTWNGGTGCSLSGDHGATAAVTCTPGVNADYTGPGGTPDGLVDPAINVALTDIDVRDPDGDSNLFEIDVVLWFNQATEIQTHQSCAVGTCENFVINQAGVYDASSNPPSIGFNPVSTEGAAPGLVQLANYGGGTGEPHPADTFVAWPLIYTTPGSHSTATSFYGLNNAKPAEQRAAAGEVVPLISNAFDYRKIDGARTQICEKLDLNNFEFVGIAPADRKDEGYSFNIRNSNPTIVAFNPGSIDTDGSDFISFLYSSEPMASIAELQSDTCEDDVNNDGFVNFVAADGSETAPGQPGDWYENPDDVPGGRIAVTKMRSELYYDTAFALSVNPAHVQWSLATTYELRVKPTAVGYGTEMWAPVWMTSRRDNGPGTAFSAWAGVSNGSIVPDDVAFSYDRNYADRLTIVPSSIAIKKATVPAGLKVVQGGDDVLFEIQPTVQGLWDDVANNTAVLNDNLPNGTTYVYGSEQFSVDGGSTWLSFSEYQASGPAVVIDNLPAAGHSAGADPLIWEFSEVENGDQLPRIRYVVHMDENRTSGTFTNTATLTSPMGVDDNENSIPDPKVASYQLSIVPTFGFDVFKTIERRVYEPNEPFESVLNYRNLGGESYSPGEFIDVFPFNGDGAVAGTGGVVASRDPGTVFDGTLSLTRLEGPNGETFEATVAPSASISNDPCHSSNLDAGEVPAPGDLCYLTFVDGGNTLPDGPAAGAGTTAWTACGSTDPVDCGGLDPALITAIRFNSGSFAAGSALRQVTVELTPSGNTPGTPAFDAFGDVTAASTGNIYTNSFGGRVPEIALRTISNDVTVTIVSGSISGHVDIDEDESASRNAGDTPLPSVDVALLIEDPANAGSFIPFLIDDPANPGTLIPYVVATLADGSYMFDDLPSGNFQVVVDTTTTPDGMVPSYDPDGGLDMLSAVTLYGPSNPAPGFGAADYLDVDEVIDQDFGVVRRGAIGDTIFFDANSNGVEDAGDVGIANVDLIVTYLGVDGVPGGGDDVDYPATTDVDGMYLVEGLPFGNYSVAVDESTVPAAYGATYDNDGGFDSVSTTSISTGDPVDLDQDFGYGVLGSIGDTIWLDQDLDGVQDPGEDGLGGVDVTVTWLGPDGVAGGGDDVVFTTTTNADGMYLVEDLPAGNYTVDVDDGDLPAGYVNVSDPDTPGTTGDNTSALTLGVGEDNLDQDFGYAGVGSIGDTVYLDRDGDGTFEPGDGELGLEGVEVQLVHYGPDGVLGGTDDSFFTTFTDLSGEYLFENLPIGIYDVTVVGGITLLDNTDDPDTVGAGDSTSQTELTVAIPDDLDQDFGYFADSVLGDKVWLDINGDGVYDPLDGEVGLPGVDILVTGPFGFSEVVTTNADGDYLVPNIPDGDYTLTVDPATLPVGLDQTFDDDGGLDNTSTTTLATSDLEQDFGYNGDGQIGDTIWLDFDGDGVIDLADGEFGLEGVTVTLEWTLPGGGVITFTTTTDADGNYLFENLPNGDYTVTVDTSTLPAGLVETFDFDGADDSTSDVTLVDGDNVRLDQDFGYNGTGSIGDTIWFDRDGDGVLDADETGFAGVDVTLVWDGPSGPVTLTTTTDADGNYLFDNLPPGDYTVTVDVADLPAGMSPTFDADGGDDSTSSLTLGDGEDNLDQDFGYNGAGSIGDTVYIDVDGDGTQGPDEPGIPGQTVELIWGGPDGVIGGGDDVVYTTTTGPDGEYLFPGLVPSEYTVTVVGGIADASTNTGDPGDDGDSTNTLTLADGEDNLDQDFGYQGNNGLGDTVWLDLNADGLDDGAAAEPRLAGVDVIVTWFGPDGVAGGGDDVVVATATTNADGAYLVGSLPDGSFSVTVDPSTLPDGIDTNTFDNDGGVDGPDGTSIVTDLGVGTDDPQVDLDQDFGYTGMASVGDTVFLDLDGDGVQDANEPGVPGVVVTVTSPGLDGISGTDDDIIVVVVTDDDGMYLVDGLPAGTTVVDYGPETLPPSYMPDSDLDGGDATSTTVELGNGDDVRDVDFGVVGDASIEGTVWIDADNDGVQDPDEAGIPGVTVVVTWDGPNGPIVISVVTDDDGNWSIPNVPSGDYTTQVDLTTLPEGLVPTTPTDGNAVIPAGGSGRVDNGFVPGASIGDRVWEDTDGDGVQDPGEPGVPGVTITLSTPGGATVRTTTTGPNGDYVFGELPPGDYVISVDPTSVPTGYVVSFDPDGTPNGSVAITVRPGDDRTDIDFGIMIPELPRTGIYIGMTLMVALGFLLAGFLLLGARRRRHVLTVS